MSVKNDRIWYLFPTKSHGMKAYLYYLPTGVLNREYGLRRDVYYRLEASINERERGPGARSRHYSPL